MKESWVIESTLLVFNTELSFLFECWTLISCWVNLNLFFQITNSGHFPLDRFRPSFDRILRWCTRIWLGSLARFRFRLVGFLRLWNRRVDDNRSENNRNDGNLWRVASTTGWCTLTASPLFGLVSRAMVRLECSLLYRAIAWLTLAIVRWLSARRPILATALIGQFVCQQTGSGGGASITPKAHLADITSHQWTITTIKGKSFRTRSSNWPPVDRLSKAGTCSPNGAQEYYDNDYAY